MTESGAFQACDTIRFMADARPIGIFDSGVGGLTVFKAIQQRLKHESLLYFGDTARVPYGTKSAETVRRYALECATFLSDQGVKMFIIACNSASALALDALRERFDVPVIGVIEAGARAAVSATRTGRVGVLGTESTIKSGAYNAILSQLQPGIRVISQPCPLFVPLVEEGWADDPITQLVAERYLKPLLTAAGAARSQGERFDTVILGCTHYPLLAEVLVRVMGHDVCLVDSAEEVARETETVLRERGLAAAPGGKIECEFYVSDLSDRFIRIAERILGRPMDRLAAVVPSEILSSPASPPRKRHAQR